jgi:hypothetical protein
MLILSSKFLVKTWSELGSWKSSELELEEEEELLLEGVLLGVAAFTLSSELEEEELGDGDLGTTANIR